MSCPKALLKMTQGYKLFNLCLENLTGMFHVKLFNLSSCALLLLSGCAVGPDFEAPSSPQTTSYTESKLPKKTVESKGKGGHSQFFIDGKDIPADWWHLFHSKPLNELIERGIKKSPTLQAAQAALRQAQENLRISVAALYPFVGLQFYPERQRFNPAVFNVTTGAPSTFNLFNATVNVSYTLDVFGGIRRQIEASEAQLDYQKFEVEATYLALTANIVTTVITEASLRSQIQATETLITLQEKTLTIIQEKFKLGGASRLDVLAQETQLAQTRATLPPLKNNLAKVRDALAILIGDLPSEAKLPTFTLDDLTLPTDLPVSLPSHLIQQRPDIKGAEALLHAANAQIGVSMANLFPQVNLTGAYGFLSNQIKTLFEHQNSIWNAIANVTQTVFQGGALIAKYDASIAAFDQAFAQYRQTVLQGFQNVADSLSALEIDAEYLQAQTNAETAAWNTYSLTQIQYKGGVIPYLALLDAERQYHLARINRIQAQAARYADTAALFQALGGGWWNRMPSCNTN